MNTTTTTGTNFANTFLKISSTAYLILMGNLLIAVVTLPVSLLLVFVPLHQAWLWLTLTFPMVFAGLAASFSTFHAHVRQGSMTVIRDFFAGWARHAKKSLVIGGLCSLFLTVIGLDLYALDGTAFGSLAAPIMVVTALIGISAGFVAVGLVVAEDSISWRRAVTLGLFLAVRKGQWSILSLAGVALFAWMIWARPATALVLAPAPLVYFIWFNTGRILASYMPSYDEMEPTPPVFESRS